MPNLQTPGNTTPPPTRNRPGHLLSVRCLNRALSRSPQRMACGGASTSWCSVTESRHVGRPIRAADGPGRHWVAGPGPAALGARLQVARVLQRGARGRLGGHAHVVGLLGAPEEADDREREGAPADAQAGQARALAERAQHDQVAVLPHPAHARRLPGARQSLAVSRRPPMHARGTAQAIIVLYKDGMSRPWPACGVASKSAGRLTEAAAASFSDTRRHTCACPVPARLAALA